MAKIKIDGENIMEEARKRCYEDFEIAGSIDLLVNILQTDELTEKEIRNLAIDILNGEAEIFNTKDGYDVRKVEPKDERYDFYGFIQKCGNEAKATDEKIKKANVEIDARIDAVKELVDDLKLCLSSAQLFHINQRFYKIFHEKLWDDLPRGDAEFSMEMFWRSFTNGGDYTYEPEFLDINDYVEFYGQPGSERWKEQQTRIWEARQGLPHKGPDPMTLSPDTPKTKNKTVKHKTSKDYINTEEKNYGFIDRSGNFIPVPFGQHEIYATCVMEEQKWTTDNKSIFSAHTDFLVLEKGYVLLDNPEIDGAPAKIYYNQAKGLNKKQKEALYDYLIKHDREQEAKYVLEDEGIHR